MQSYVNHSWLLISWTGEARCTHSVPVGCTSSCPPALLHNLKASHNAMHVYAEASLTVMSVAHLLWEQPRDCHLN